MKQTILVREAFGPRLERRSEDQSPGTSGELLRDRLVVPALRQGPVCLDFTGMDFVGGSGFSEATCEIGTWYPELDKRLDTDLTFRADSAVVQVLIDDYADLLQIARQRRSQKGTSLLDGRLVAAPAIA